MFCIYVFHTLKGERNMLLMKDLTFSAFYTEIFGGAYFITTLMENIFCNVSLSFTRVCKLGCIILLKYLRRARKVSQGAGTLFKVC